MILIADGGSTKVDWVALDSNKNEVFRTQTLGLNPSVVSAEELFFRINNSDELKKHQNLIKEVYFYGAGCGTQIPKNILKNILTDFFLTTTNIQIEEDILGAVYASTRGKKAIVCILGTGSNSCYFDGNSIEYIAPSLGYLLMDEASGNYFGKKLLRDFFYKKMPEKIALIFKESFDLNPTIIKQQLYDNENPNRYLASFAKFMFDYKENSYIKKLIKKGFEFFFKFHVLAYHKSKKIPLYFVGSIAFYFKDILKEVASSHKIKITNIICKPIDNLVEYHKHII